MIIGNISLFIEKVPNNIFVFSNAEQAAGDKFC